MFTHDIENTMQKISHKNKRRNDRNVCHYLKTNKNDWKPPV